MRTKTEAYEAMLRHHATLLEEVHARAAALRRAVSGGFSFEPAVAELVAYMSDEVLPHALAEEKTIYQTAAARPELAATVATMIAEHGRLAAVLDQLSSAEEREKAAATAGALAELFAAHVTKENDVLLPALVSDEKVNLGELLGEMHRLTEQGAGEPVAGEEAVAGADTESDLLLLLLEAASDLAEVGRDDRACRLAADAWRSVRTGRPDLAARATAALHRLARQATTEPVALRRSGGAPSAEGEPDLDVRSLAPALRHEAIFTCYRALEPGTGFVLVNDHDPKPLRYQFEAEHAGEFSWDYLESGPRTWRVRIGRAPR